MWKIIVTVQYGRLLDECNRLYDGSGYGTVHSDRNGEAVIDLLKEWDGMDGGYEVEDKEPRWVDDGSDYVYHKDGYTLIYNPTIGGVYMLYKEILT